MTVTRDPAPINDALRARLATAGRNRTKADEALKAAVRDARQAGASVRVIAAIAGISTNTVQAWTKP